MWVREGAISVSMALHYSMLIGEWDLSAKSLGDLPLGMKLVTEEPVKFVWSQSVGGQVGELLRR
jgi:hypothetical protein